MPRETSPQCFNRRLHAITQSVECANAGLLSLLGPAIQPRVPDGSGEAALVTDEPEKRKVRIDFAVEHVLEVELNVSLPSERRIVPKQPQLAAIAYDTPSVIWRVVQKLLDEAVWARCGSADPARGAPIKVLAKPN